MRAVARHVIVAAVATASCGRVGFDATAKLASDAAIAPADAAPDAAPADLQISLTADIAYVAEVGTDTALLARLGSAINGLGSGDIASCPVGLGPEAWTFTRASEPSATFVYIAVWDDEELERGWVGAITPVGGGSAILTGDPGWQVCSTGDWPGGMGMVSDQRISNHLAQCNAGSSPSKGWLDAAGPITPGAIGHLVVGPAQSTGMPLGPVCSAPGGVPLAANWIWYHPTLDDLAAFSATGSDDDQGFLIFRHPI